VPVSSRVSNLLTMAHVIQVWFAIAIREGLQISGNCFNGCFQQEASRVLDKGNGDAPSLRWIIASPYSYRKGSPRRNRQRSIIGNGATATISLLGSAPYYNTTLYPTIMPRAKQEQCNSNPQFRAHTMVWVELFGLAG